MKKASEIVYKLLCTIEIMSLVCLFILLALEICCAFGASDAIEDSLKKINISFNKENLPLLMGIITIFTCAIEFFKGLVFKKF